MATDGSLSPFLTFLPLMMPDVGHVCHTGTPDVYAAPLRRPCASVEGFTVSEKKKKQLESWLFGWFTIEKRA